MGVSSTDASELAGASLASASTGSAAGSSYPPGIGGSGVNSVCRGSWFVDAAAGVAGMPGGSTPGREATVASPPAGPPSPCAVGLAAGGRARQEKGVAPSRLKGAVEPSPDSAERNAGTAGSGTSRVGATGAASLAGPGTAVSSAGSSTPSRSIVVWTGGAAGGESGGAATVAGEIRASRGVETGAEAGGWPHARPASGGRATGTGGGRTSVRDTSGSSAAGAAASKWADASKTSLHWPQRTHPSEMRNWSATTLNVVEQDGQRVIWLISAGL